MRSPNTTTTTRSSFSWRSLRFALLGYALGVVSTCVVLQIVGSYIDFTRSSSSSHVNWQLSQTFAVPEMPTLSSPLSASTRRLYQYEAAVPRPGSSSSSNSEKTFCGRPPGYEAYFALSSHNRSLSNEDQTIYKLFFRNTNNQNLKYVELGAFEGREESNSRFFDDCLGWDGLLIEANPKTYQKLVANRPNAHRYSLAASCSNESTVGFWSSSFTNAVQDTSENRIAYAGKPNTKLVQVPCGSLTPVILDAFPEGRVHFLSLDVEGAEADVVSTLDFSKVFVDVIISENFNRFCIQGCEAVNKTRQLMQQHGYLLFPQIVSRSDLYVHPNSNYVQEFLRRHKPQPQHIRGATTTRISNALAPLKGSDTTKWGRYNYHAPELRSELVRAQNVDLCGIFPSFVPYWSRGLAERSRLDEDKTIFQLFFQNLTLESMRDFHYVELGAFDGVGESNTRFFDTCLSWEGLLIEPNPKVFSKLVENRPNAHRMNYAASCSSEPFNATVGFWSSAFTNAVQDDSVNREAYANHPESKFTEVPCGPLAPVLSDVFAKNKRVHFFSLDVEGAEHMILEHVDFNEIFVDVMIAESINNFCQKTCEARDKTRAIMKTNGFTLYPNVVKNSDLYVHKKSEFAHLVPTSALALF